MPTILQPYVNLISITDKAQELIEYCGRKCWKSEDKIEPGSASKFIKMLKNKKHISVIEHASATFEIITDRGISHEIVRHRIASFSQESTRYCNYSKTTGKMTGEIFVIKPSGMSEQESAEWWDAMLDAERHYLNLLKMGSTPQRARSVLPTCTKTDIAVTMNFRAWLHFIDLRAKAPPAHPDIAPLAQAIQKILVEKAGAVFSEEAV
jgi:thymidylate synthase (FAD)